MGTSFVTITDGITGDEPGFWMRDEMLELWLRLLSLHLPEPNDNGENTATPDIRNRWLLASRGYFNGCVPHEMEYACVIGRLKRYHSWALQKVPVSFSG